MTTPSSSPPKSILIVGAGVFGLSTAHALLSNPNYAQTSITIIDAYSPSPSSQSQPQEEYTASLDTSRIIRPDYTNPLYAALADEATCRFRSGWAEDPHAAERTYSQSGLVLISTGGDGCRGMGYVEGSLRNVRELAEAAQAGAGGDGKASPAGKGNSGTAPVVLSGREEVERLYDLKQRSLPEYTTGYLNPQAGWANASAGIAAIKKKVLEMGKTREKEAKAPFKYLDNTKVSSLLLASLTKVCGVSLSTGSSITAEITIVATGAWTPALLPELFGSRVRATGQVLAYIPLHTAEEVAKYAGKPVVLDMESGLFAIFPPEHYVSEDRAEGHVKMARHGWGYAYPRTVKDPRTGKEIEVWSPPENKEDFFYLPKEGQDTLRDFARMVVPDIAGREFSLERVCWYTDTPTGDFLIDFVPGIEGLVLATGGSGHGYKFLPVIGEKIVDRLEGKLDKGLAELWKWRNDSECEELWKGEGDSSRGGPRGMLWEEELKR